MQEQQEQMWINELKNDFPDYLTTIELLDWEVEQFFDLAEEYYICKHHIQMLKKSGKKDLLKEFESILTYLKSDISSVLQKKKEQF